MTFREKIKAKRFTVTAEISAKKGFETDYIQKQVNSLRGSVDAINATDNQRACVRLSSLTASVKIIEAGAEPILQMTCRDRNRIALQSDLIGAYALGIRNVLIISGDHPRLGDHPDAKPVYDLDSTQLISTVKSLNNGCDMAGNKLESACDFLIGGAMNPGAKDIDLERIKIRKKIDSGVDFFQTQAIYDVDLFRSFIKGLSPGKPNILAGIIPLKSARMGRFLNDNIPGVNVPQSIIKELETSDDPYTVGVEQAARIISDIKDVCDGVHIMSLGAIEKIPLIIERSGLANDIHG